MKRELYIEPITLLLVIVIAIASCSDGSAERLQSLKKSGKLYPKGQIQSIKALIFIDTQYVWVNTSYKDYTAKDLFPQLINFEFDLKDQTISSIVTSDTFALSGILSERLRAKGIAHFIGQTLLNNKLNIYFHSNHDELEAFTLIHDLGMPASTIFKEDAGWKRYQELLDRK